jgi:phytoene dehydrogenase-like protein
VSEAFDAIVVGGGHNGLVATAYLAKAGLKVLVLEARRSLGGPCGTFEFLPGYKTAFSNSPGSFEPRFVEELHLADYGLRFVRTDPTVIHYFPGRCFVGWRDRNEIVKQLDSFAPGEADRYFGLLSSLEDLGRHMGVSLFAKVPDPDAIRKRLPPAQAGLFDRVVKGSLADLLDDHLRSTQAKALLGMVALNATYAPPSAPGTAIGLMLRPISLVSAPRALGADDPRQAALRGSTGLPFGAMGAIVDAVAGYCRAHGVEIHTGEPATRILYDNGRVTGVETAKGRYHAPRVISAINPKTLFAGLLDDQAVGGDLRRQVAGIRMEGSAFKMVLALDGLPDYAGLPEGATRENVAGVQFRICDSLDYLERSITDSLAGIPSREPIMWGLIPTVVSPHLAPPGRHLLSVNIWHAPYHLAKGDWSTEVDVFGERCLDVLERFMPGMRQRILDRRYMGPREIEAELGLVESHITHGDMLPGSLLGGRPLPALSDFRTPLQGLYLSGAGVWPGGYVTGIPGFNASDALLSDRANSK